MCRKTEAGRPNIWEFMFSGCKSREKHFPLRSCHSTHLHSVQSMYLEDFSECVQSAIDAAFLGQAPWRMEPCHVTLELNGQRGGGKGVGDIGKVPEPCLTLTYLVFPWYWQLQILIKGVPSKFIITTWVLDPLLNMIHALLDVKQARVWHTYDNMALIRNEGYWFFRGQGVVI